MSTPTSRWRLHFARYRKPAHPEYGPGFTLEGEEADSFEPAPLQGTTEVVVDDPEFGRVARVVAVHLDRLDLNSLEFELVAEGSEGEPSGLVAYRYEDASGHPLTEAEREGLATRGQPVYFACYEVRVEEVRTRPADYRELCGLLRCPSRDPVSG